MLIRFPIFLYLSHFHSPRYIGRISRHVLNDMCRSSATLLISRISYHLLLGMLRSSPSLGFCKAHPPLHQYEGRALPSPPSGLLYKPRRASVKLLQSAVLSETNYQHVQARKYTMSWGVSVVVDLRLYREPL